jgi:hypothetical protein
LSQQRIVELGEIAVKRLAIATLKEKLLTAAKNYRTKAIPLRLETPPVCIRRNLIDPLSEHGQDRR